MDVVTIAVISAFKPNPAAKPRHPEVRAKRSPALLWKTQIRFSIAGGCAMVNPRLGSTGC